MSKVFAVMAYQMYSLLKFCCQFTVLTYPVVAYTLLDKL